MFIQVLPKAMSAVGCFTRIQEFLVSRTRQDTRGSVSIDVPIPGINEHQQAGIELTEFVRPQANHKATVSIVNGSFGWSKTSNNVLEHVNIEIKRSELAMIVGTVGSGKSTLLKAMLGETETAQGHVNIHASKISFCDQTPWLMYGTIKDNIIGTTAFDPIWYRRVVSICALQKDVDDMPEGDQTLIGSRGLALSGGQKQRIVRMSLSVLDQTCSGL
jgi:ATP-binding cassette subfamily C (CFTR/MRP) protein 1